MQRFKKMAFAANKSPYIDEVTTSGLNPMGFRKASLNPAGAEPVEGIQSAQIAENEELLENDFSDQLDGEFEFEKDFQGVDEFVSQEEAQQKQQRQGGGQGGQQGRRDRKLGKIKRAKSLAEQELEEEKLELVLENLDELIQVELEDDELDDFDQWNKWFKTEKKAPPEPDPSRVLYIREEFNTKRSPHLWKSDPDKKWVLGFGNSKVNNVVSSILYKYQNETISKDA